jgi:predicted ATPase
VGLNKYWARNYRSLVDVELDLGQLTVVVGQNGSGKTNLYRALELISRGARGELARTLLKQGGMPSVLYAGNRPRRKGEPARVVVGVNIDDLSYELALGLPPPSGTVFPLDPEVKEEVVWFGPRRTPRSIIADRAGSTAILVGADGVRVPIVTAINPAEPVLSQVGDPTRFPELFALRNSLAGWRFYHDFPTGQDAHARWPQTGVRTPVLADDGHDLAAAVATIQEIGASDLLEDAIAEAFPGSQLDVLGQDGTYALQMQQLGLSRPTLGAEFSDGTLRFLYLAVALLSPRAPGLLVINEPETGLHAPVLAPLAGLIREASSASQVFVTTHSQALADLLADCGSKSFTVTRASDGVTEVKADRA